MSLTVDPSLAALMERQLVRPAFCWRIIRRDKIGFRFTTHDRNLTFGGFTYLSAATIQASALERGGDLREGNRTLRGAITSDAITQADLIQGKFKGAQVREFFLDWKYPDAGQMVIADYVIRELRYDGTAWQATIVDFKGRLNRQIGRRYNRTCDYTFGDPSTCGVTIPVAVETVTSAPERNRIRVTSTQFTSFFDGFDDLKRGTVSFVDLTSPLRGTKQVIKSSQRVSSVSNEYIIEFYLDLPQDATVGERVNIRPGCSHAKRGGGSGQGCFTWDNIPAFGGFSFIPGFDGALETPF